jgi:uncharacterized membrane protein YecN with MAPEG domain
MPVTSLYAALLAALFLFLTSRVIRLRRGHRVDMGDGGDRLLQRYVRAHANCAEYAPFGLLLLLLVEAGGWPGPVVHGLGLMLLGGRSAHAWSFSVAELREPSRVVGMALTTTMLGLAALLCLARGLGLA